MENELTKYWTKKSFFYISLIWLFSNILFTVLATILINTATNKLINILLILGINALILLILFAFSINKYTYETVYQIKVANSIYETKYYRYLLILFSFAWLIFFGLNGLLMLVNNAAYQTKTDYFDTINTSWWICLTVAFYNVLLIALHRQLIYYTLTNSKLPWNKTKK